MAEDVQLNWIERRALREKILRDHANDVWQDARSAVQNCCESFRTHYGVSIAKLEDKLENGLRIRLSLTFQVVEASFQSEVKRIILVAFDASVPCIFVTADDKPARQFRIDADENEAFITEGDNQRITTDEFSKKALETSLFTKPNPPKRRPPKGPAGSTSWMA